MKSIQGIVVIFTLLLGMGQAAAQEGREVFEPNVDRPGQDYRSFDLNESRPELCLQACMQEDRCQAFTYVNPGVQGPKPRCWLKTAIPQATASTCCTTGVKPPGLESKIDRPGSDYRDFDLNEARPELCQKACLNDAACRAFTYVSPGVQGPKPRCWLKNAVPPATFSECCTSGIKAANPPPPAKTLEPGVDRPGSDYRNFDLDETRPELCQQACANEATCRAFTYVKPGVQGPKARCWLKNAVPAPKPSDCCTSGVK